MKNRVVALATLLAVSSLSLGALPASAVVPVPARCLTGLGTDTVGGFGNLTGLNTQLLVFAFSNPRAAIAEGIRIVGDLADATFTDTGQRVFQSDFVRRCLLEDLQGLLALTDATTGAVSAANRAQFCEEVAALRARLTQIRADGRINNCYFRLTCGFTSAGLLLRCDEDVRVCLTLLLDNVLLAASNLALCNAAV